MQPYGHWRGHGVARVAKPTPNSYLGIFFWQKCFLFRLFTVQSANITFGYNSIYSTSICLLMHAVFFKLWDLIFIISYVVKSLTHFAFGRPPSVATLKHFSDYANAYGCTVIIQIAMVECSAYIAAYRRTPKR